MDEDERWIYLDGPEPERLRPLLDALRDAPPSTAEDRARAVQRFFAQLDGEPQGEAREESQGSQRENESIARRHVTAEVQEDETETSEQRAVVDGGSAAPQEPPAPAPVVLDMPVSGRAPAYLARTAPALDLPPEVRAQRPALPFEPAGAIPAAGAKPGAKTMELPVMRRGFGETTPVGDDSIATSVALVPFEGAAGLTAVVTFPPLTLEQVASLRAELNAAPEKRAEILRSYHVPHEASLRALDDHWDAKMAAEPQVRAAFAQALATFTNYVRARQR